ncbi:MAG: AI-2E family transporter [Oscillospiraceae bacterium]
MELNKKNVRTILLIITFAVVIFALVQNLGGVYTAIKSVWGVLDVVIAGLGVAFVLNVPLRAFETHVFRSWKEGDNPKLRKLVRPLSLIGSACVAFGIVALLLVVVIPQLSKTISELAVKLPEYITIAIAWVEKTLESFSLSTGALDKLTVNWEGTIDKLVDFLKDGAGGILGTAGSVGASVVGGAMNLVFSIIIAVYVLAKKERIGGFTKRALAGFLPQKVSRQILRVASMADEIFGSFISGQLTDSTILGILCYIGMRIFRFPYPEVIAVVIGVTSLVPMVGSFIGEVIGVFLILFVKPLQALLFILFILCLQQIDNTFIYPKIVGKSVGLPGLLVLCAVVIGGNVFGVLGSLLSVPVCALLYALLREMMETREKHNASLNQRT